MVIFDELPGILRNRWEERNRLLVVEWKHLMIQISYTHRVDSDLGLERFKNLTCIPVQALNEVLLLWLLVFAPYM